MCVYRYSSQRGYVGELNYWLITCFAPPPHLLYSTQSYGLGISIPQNQ